MNLNSSEYILKKTAAATTEPVSLEQSKADLRIEDEFTIDDSYIEGLISAATEFVSGPNGITGKALVSQTWTLSQRCPDGNGRIYFPLTPVVSISSITYFDAANASQNLTVSDFLFYTTEDWAYIEAKPGVSWPGTYRRLDAITVTFVAGFGAAAAVPENIKRAIRLLVAHWYENRVAVVVGTTVEEVPLGFDALVGISRKGWVG